jgi:hypothetical protein
VVELVVGPRRPFLWFEDRIQQKKLLPLSMFEDVSAFDLLSLGKSAQGATS